MAHTYVQRLTPAFKRELRAWLERNPRSKAELARQVGVSSTAIDKMLAQETASSAHRDAVAEYCGIDILSVEADDEKERRLVEALRGMTREEKDELLETIERVQSKHKG